MKQESHYCLGQENHVWRVVVLLRNSIGSFLLIERKGRCIPERPTKSTSKSVCRPQMFEPILNRSSSSAQAYTRSASKLLNHGRAKVAFATLAWRFSLFKDEDGSGQAVSVETGEA